MMKFTAHRKNTLEKLNASPKEYGAEVDTCSYGNKLVIHHDPFIEEESFKRAPTLVGKVDWA
jgi:hypothetical protein